jgi:cellulose synthase/poly-beta-1,6-N-acetylglucosamine synthase-like glycosyltransferase
MSFFAIAIYSVGGVKTSMKNINESFEASISFKDNTCPPGKWERIFINLLNAIYKHLIMILYLIVLSYSTYLIFSTMKSSSSKIILGSFLTLIIFGIIMGIFLMVYNSDPNIKKSDIDI